MSFGHVAIGKFIALSVSAVIVAIARFVKKGRMSETRVGWDVVALHASLVRGVFRGAD